MLRDLTKASEQRRIFVFFNGAHHISMFLSLFEQNRDIDFFIYSKSITVEKYRESPLGSLDNVYFVQDIGTIKYKLLNFGLYLSTDMQMANPHAPSLHLASIFKALNIPTVELQHGLFQLGLHYYDQPYRENIAGDSLPSLSLADHILMYYPVEVSVPHTIMGYPPYTTKELIYQGEYPLILSNMHWGTYSSEEKYRFYQTVIQHINDSDEKLFIWKPHHGEIMNKWCAQTLDSLFTVFPEAQKKILFYHKNEMLQRIQTPELIKKSKYVISTVSTVLLDCEIHHKKTCVYACDSNRCLIDKLQTCTTFECYDDLSKIDFSQATFETGSLHPYNNTEFRKCVNSLYQYFPTLPPNGLDLLNNLKV